MTVLFYVICISRNNSPDQYNLPFPFETGIVAAQEGALGSVYNKNEIVQFIGYMYGRIEFHWLLS